MYFALTQTIGQDIPQMLVSESELPRDETDIHVTQATYGEGTIMSQRDEANYYFVDVVLDATTFTIETVPEPGAAWMVLLAMGSLGLARPRSILC